MQISAGILAYRRKADEIEFFLVHPGGPFFKNKKNGVYSIPKGLVAHGEDLLAAAIREFEEEIGHRVTGDFIALGSIVQNGGKTVHAWAVEAEIDETTIHSNTFPLEWPPKSGKIQHFPEVDSAGWFTIDTAKLLIIQKQVVFLDRLMSSLKISPPSVS